MGAVMAIATQNPQRTPKHMPATVMQHLQDIKCRNAMLKDSRGEVVLGSVVGVGLS